MGRRTLPRVPPGGVFCAPCRMSYAAMRYGPRTLHRSVDGVPRERKQKDMLGGVATICGVCSYRWIVSPAVARSYRCPKCGGAWGHHVAKHACTCGHRYDEHHFKASLPASRGAFGITANEVDELPRILAAVQTIPHKIGRCRTCPCERFTYVGSQSEES